MSNRHPDGVRYRPAHLDDARSLAEMRWDFRLEERPDLADAHDRDTFVRTCEGWVRHRIALGTWTVWVAEVDGEIVSHVYVNLVDKVPKPGKVVDRLGYATNVYTRPQWRNRRIGADLMEWVKGWALGADLEFLILWPSEDSREFYARAGFVPEAWAVTFELRPYEG